MDNLGRTFKKVQAFLNQAAEWDKRTGEIHTDVLWDIIEPVIDLYEDCRATIARSAAEQITELPEGLRVISDYEATKNANLLYQRVRRAKRKFFRLILTANQE